MAVSPIKGEGDEAATEVTMMMVQRVWAAMACYKLLKGCKDTLAEWLRPRPAKPMGSPRVGSNPTGVDLLCLPWALSLMTPAMTQEPHRTAAARRRLSGEVG